MAKKDVYRPMKTSFWVDKLVLDEFSPEDKYFYLYITTNTHTTQLGIYKFNPKVAAFETGYSKETIMVLLERFERHYNVIKYSHETQEIAIKNYLKDFLVGAGKPTFDCLKGEIDEVEDESLILYIYNSSINNNIKNNTVLEFLDYVSNEYLIIKKEVVDELSTNCAIKKSESKINKQEVDDFFNTCWKAYPRKLGKGDVKPATKKKLYKEVGEEQMLRCIERYKQDNIGTEEKYLKYGGTFFNSGYIDYLDENYSVEKNDLQNPEVGEDDWRE